MKRCPSENDLQGLLADRLPVDQRTSVEGHIEACPTCQRQLEALTQAVGLKLAPPPGPPCQGGEAFLERLQSEYPDTLFKGEAAGNGTLHFPGPATERAPLGQVGDFEILEELGSGSFGWVFRARERSLNRIVALKVLKPEMTARPEAIVRFEREARKASLKHDHIVNVYRFEKPNGFPPYLVMEFIEGETLEARLKHEGKLTPEAAASIARQVALGLAAAHEHGMVHRDIKPANILLDKTTGRAKISDFGLARDVANESMAVTGAGELAGTAPYMSPEHFRAPEKVDGRSDLFSLGIVLYQLLTGELPFKGSFLQVRSGILEDEPTSPRRLNDSIPVDLETITLACLEKDPDRRYATAQAIAEDLRRYQNGEPILCRPTGQVERATKWIRRKPAQAALVAVGTIAILILAVLIAGYFVNAQLQDVNKNLAEEKDKFKKANDQLIVEEAAVQRLNYIADMNLAHQAWQNDNFRLLEQYLANHENSNLRGFEWHYLRWLANTDGRRIGPKEAVTVVALDAKGHYLALGVLAGNEAQVQIWSTPSREKPAGEVVQTLVRQANPVTDIAFHPTKDLLITSDRQGTIQVWDRGKNQKLRDIVGNGPLAVSADGERLAYVRVDGAVQRWSFAQQHDEGSPLPIAAIADTADSDKGKRGSPSPRVPSKDRTKGDKGDEPQKGRGGKIEPSGIESLAFSFDGLRLAAVGGRYATGGVLAVWEIKSGKQLSLEDAQQGDLLTSVAFSPDGQSIAAVGFDHALRAWDTKTGRLRFRRVAHKLEVNSVAYNATGDLLATAGWDQTIKIWNARTGEELRNLHGNRGVIQQVLFGLDTNNDGKDNIVSLNEYGTLRWWDAGQEQTARVTVHREPVHALAFSPKGRYLASFGRNLQVLIQDLVEPNPPQELTMTTPGSRGFFSHDESTLFSAGSDKVLQTWPFVKGGDAIDVPNIDFLASQRIVVRMDGQSMVSQAFPSAREPLQNLLPFGIAQAPAPTIVAVDASGEHLAFVSSDGKLVLRKRDVESGVVSDKVLQLPGTSKASQTVNAIAFSPDGQYLAAGINDYSILVFDTATGKSNQPFTGHLCLVSCVAFSPDGKRLASGSEDWTVKLWDIEVGRATLTLSGHKGRIRDLAFSTDGTLLASASEDATVRVWPGILESAEDRAEPRDSPSRMKRGGK
jgi:WD40 repeat protein